MTDINKKVEWSSYAKEGKMEGVNKSQIVKAIGTKDFCKSIQREIENPRETYVYTITPSLMEPSVFILIQNWEGFYD